MQDLTVLFLSGSYAPDKDGVSDYTRILRKKLRERGFCAPVLTTREAAFANPEPGVIGAVDDWRPSSLVRIARAVRETGPDVLHVQWAPGSYRFQRSLFYLVPLLRAFAWQGPVVTTLHEYGNWELSPSWLPSRLDERIKTFGQSRGWWDREAGFLLSMSDRVICTNDHVFNLLYDRLPQLLERIRKVPLGPNIGVHNNGHDPRRYLRETFGWPDASPVVVFFGFVHPVKGLETLFQAFKQVLERIPHARLLVVGGHESLSLPAQEAGDYAAELRALLAGLGIEREVAFTGFLPDETASEFLQGADVGVLPFNHGVNLKSGSLLAMLAHGLPTIATHHDPPDTLLEQRQAVSLVRPRAAGELASALERLLTDPQARADYSLAGRALAGQFSWQRILDDHESIYRGLFFLP